MQTQKFQKWATQKVSSLISKQLDAKVALGKVKIKWWKQLSIDDFIVYDKTNDTLLYVEKTTIDINEVSFSKKDIDIHSINLKRAKAFLLKDSISNNYNYQFIVDSFKNGNANDSSNWNIKLHNIYCINSTLQLQDKRNLFEKKGKLNMNDLFLSDLNCKIKDIKTVKDTTGFNIESLSFKDKSSFITKELSLQSIISKNSFHLNKIKFLSPKSSFQLNTLSFYYDSIADFSNFEKKVKINASIENSTLFIEEINYFSDKKIANQLTSLSFKGHLEGYINNLKIKNIRLNAENTTINGNAYLNGLPKVKETFGDIELFNSTTNKKDLENILQLFDIPTNFPQAFNKLGNINFKGKLTGFYNDFVTYGSFSSAIGNFKADASFYKKETSNIYSYKGKVNCNNFNLGSFLSEKTLRYLSTNISVEGKGFDENAYVLINGDIEQLDFNKYSYKNINANGKLAKKFFTGKINSKDKNLHLDFDGEVDFNATIPNFNFTANIDNANIKALNIYTEKEFSNVKGIITANGKGKNIDEFIGLIKAEKIRYAIENQFYNIDHVSILFGNNNKEKILTINSDVIDANMHGNYSISGLAKYSSNLVNQLFNINNENVKQNYTEEEFDLSLKLKNIKPIISIFNKDILAHENTLLNVLHKKNNHNEINIQSPQISILSNKIENILLHYTQINDELSFNVEASEWRLSEKSILKKIKSSANLSKNKGNFAIAFNNDSIKKTSASISGQLERLTNSLIISLNESQLHIGDSLWTIASDGKIKIDTATAYISDINLKNKNQSININGFLFSKKQSPLEINLNQFNLNNISAFAPKSFPSISGEINGKIGVSNLTQTPIITSALSIKKLFINNEIIGDGVINNEWRNDLSALTFNGFFTRGIVKNINYTGTYWPFKENENIDIACSLESIKLEPLENLVKEYCSAMKGQVSGNLNISGSIEEPVFNGNLFVQLKKIKVNYLNTSYNLVANIQLDKNSLGIEDVIAYDENGNKANIRGKLFHDNFKNFQLDFDILATKFNCLNTNEALNNLYYGKANLSGMINIFGFLNDVLIECNVKTEPGTQISIPVNSVNEVENYDFITFKSLQKETIKKTAEVLKKNNIRLNLGIEVTPEAEAQIIFDSKSGDIIKGKGEGNIKLVINSSGEFNMFGNYSINNGSYLFTLKDIINKKFDLEQGGYIKWAGDPYNADIFINAIYKLKSPLLPFFPSDLSGVYNKRFPINCKLVLSEKLLKPSISFDIDLPTVDENTRQVVKNYFKTEQDLNEQVFSLLLLNSFITPPALRNIGVVESRANTNVGSTTTSELLSNQLTNMLSKISNDFDIGVRYRPGDAITSEQVELALSTQLFNDRLSIDGNLGVSGTNTTAQNQTEQGTSNMVGDINMEYKINKNGKFRIRAFNKVNDNIILINNGTYTQGAGIAFREDFNNIKDLWYNLFRRKKKAKATKI